MSAVGALPDADAVPLDHGRASTDRPWPGVRYRPAMLHISHHERVEGHPHRWHVFLHGREHPIAVELDPEERRSLELTDDELHDRLPTALERHYTDNRDDLIMVPGEQYNEASWDNPVRLLQNHFV